ncbi:MAG: thioredoxin family protein [Myxococcota bacterium]|nr:thioredoxin family protein [Myxococcota bacterium]
MNVRPPLALVFTTVATALALLGCGDTRRAPSGLDVDPWLPKTEEELDARILEARAQARESDRQVLLDFIADWCEDCREVVRLSKRHPARGVIEEKYVVVYVEVGRFDRHRHLIERYAIDRIATLVVLDPESGERVAQTTLEPITGGQRGLTSAQLAAWLRDPS